MLFLRSIVVWFASLESGASFQKWIQIILKILGVVAFVFIIVSSILLVVTVIAEIGSISSLLFHLSGSILIALFTIAVGIILILLIWNRCNKINTLQNESDFTLLNIAVILVRLSGEVVLIVNVATCFHLLLGGIFGIGMHGMISFLYNPVIVVESISIGWSFDWSIRVISIITFAINGITILISSYVIAALLNLVVGMAKDLRNIDATLSTEETTSDS